MHGDRPEEESEKARTVECGLCPHRCKLREGQRGICFARQCLNGQVTWSAYGQLSALALDPIEKKPLYHFLPGTQTLSTGTIGCNLACRFCQNATISKPTDERSLGETVLPEQLADLAVRADCPSVSFTYNEPIVSFEYTVDAARACRARGLKTIAVTAGYIEPEPRRTFFGALDAANIDLKAFTDSFYRRLCGIHLQPVLDTLLYVKNETKVWLELTTLLIPGENDSDEELDALTQWIAAKLGVDVPLHFSAFFPTHKLLDRPPTPAATLTRARAIGLRNGLRYVYTGNVRDLEGGSTRCAGCGASLIERDGYRLTALRLRQGACPDCGAPCAGRFA